MQNLISINKLSDNVSNAFNFVKQSDVLSGSIFALGNIGIFYLADKISQRISNQSHPILLPGMVTGIGVGVFNILLSKVSKYPSNPLTILITTIMAICLRMLLTYRSMKDEIEPKLDPSENKSDEAVEESGNTEVLSKLSKNEFDEELSKWKSRAHESALPKIERLIHQGIIPDISQFDRILAFNYKTKGRGVTYLFEVDGKFGRLVPELKKASRILVLICPSGSEDNESFKKHVWSKNQLKNNPPQDEDIKNYYKTGADYKDNRELIDKCTFHWVEPQVANNFR